MPPVKAKPELTENVGVKEGQFGVPDVMTYGLRTIKSDMEIPHPIMALERNVSGKLITIEVLNDQRFFVFRFSVS